MKKPDDNLDILTYLKAFLKHQMYVLILKEIKNLVRLRVYMLSLKLRVRNLGVQRD